MRHTPRLRLNAIVRKRFPEPLGAVSPRVHGYLGDLAAAHGRAADTGDERGTGYPAMAEALFDALPEREFEVVVLAAAVPDLDPSYSLSTYVQAALPGDPFVFAITEQGPAATFTALRCASAYARERALVLAFDQSRLPYRCAEPLGDAALALVLGTTGTPLELWRFPSAGTDPALGADTVLCADPAFPCTGLWSRSRGRVASHAIEPGSGALSCCVWSEP
ncbi:hypothetical protein [Sciscionella sediminilitoris]|uniref:hypothetical protein n=1 Tax=Sciscionella sediminilitoris TaxID=1445613 RepID=UPI0004DF426F|nr:hypothetical protein [Sciscionella sp. SE31]